MEDIFVLHRPHGEYPEVNPGVYVCRKCGQNVIIRDYPGADYRLKPCPKCDGIQFQPLMGLGELPGLRKRKTPPQM